MQFNWREWTRKQWFVYALLALVGVAIILQILLWLGLSINSLTGEELTIFLQSDKEHITLEHGDEATVGFTVGVTTLPFCEVTCNWSMVDTADNSVISSGADVLRAGEKQQHEVTVQAAPSGRFTSAYQFQTSCSPKQSGYCKADQQHVAAASVTVVDVTYTDDEEKAAQTLLEQLPAWSENLARDQAALQFIAQETDPRIPAIRDQAAQELQAIQAHIQAMQEAKAADDVLRAAQLLQQVPSAGAITRYEQTRTLEAAISARYASFLDIAPEVSALQRVATPADAARMQQATNAVNTAIVQFTTSDVNALDTALNTYNSTVAALQGTYATQTITRAAQAQQLLLAEQRMACTLKAGACPANSTTAQTLVHAVAQLQTVCADIQLLNATFEEAQRAYAQQLIPGGDVQTVEAQYNVSVIRADPAFNQTAQGLRDAARTGLLGTQDPALRLAVPLYVSAQTAAIPCTFTSFNATLLARNVTAQLKALPTNITPVVLDDMLPRCCSLGVCAQCAVQPRYPVVFVHGHSFVDSTSPESNMNAFTQMAFTLQDDGYLYAGHVFPLEDVQGVPYAELNELPTGVSFTATYYYNSYPEEGKTSFVVQKTEDIETYALRLREAIAVVKHKTGAPKVVLVSHSMGGLVSRRYLQLFGEQDVAALVMIGTPNHGISDRTQTLCPLFGSERECEDMASDSVFIAKLNRGREPAIPVYTIAGTGCSNRAFDGVVETQSVALPFAQNTVVQGTCPSNDQLLHSMLLNAQQFPQVYAHVRSVIQNATVQ